MNARRRRHRLYRRFGKRLLDAAVAVTALVALAPVLLLLAAAVRLLLGSPVLFVQARPGRHGERFPLLKLRTMTDLTDALGAPLPDAERLTRFGRFLRRTSLDELPELVNVLRGDMSLVGPRPLLVQYLARYTPRQARRHEVRPGITGLAQVSGRNALSWEEKFELDVEYVERLSLGLDLSILARTVRWVLGGKGVSAQGHSTMPEFLGSREGDAGGPATDPAMPSEGSRER
jgi:lipopolysaccharide/colanic/teichoic acid biosynthesis glycosyltransferase